MPILKNISGSISSLDNVSTPKSLKSSIVSKSVENKRKERTTPDSHKPSRTSQCLEKLSNIKRKSRTQYRTKTEWYHHNTSNDFLSASSDDDFVSTIPRKRTKHKKIGCKQAIKSKKDQNQHSFFPVAKIPSVVTYDVKPEKISTVIETNVERIIPIKSTFVLSNVTPEKNTFQIPRNNVVDISCLNAMMGHYNKAMYELNLAYSACHVLRERLSSDALHNVPVSFATKHMLSDVSTKLDATMYSVKEEEITCVPETEQEPTSLDFQK